MRLVMLATGPFSAPTLRALYAAEHQVAALVTQPLRAAKGRQEIAPSPLREMATTHGTPILDPVDVNTPESRQALAALAPELLVVVDYGQILAPETLAVAPLGGINLHGSLLPRYRGAAPINWAIHRGERETGVTVIHMTPRVDAGPSLAQARTPIDPVETAIELEHRLAELGAPLVCQTIAALVAGRATEIVQDPALASKARRLRKTDGEVDWTRSSRQIFDQVRALKPWPKTFTSWHRASGEPFRLILDRVTIRQADSLLAGTPVTQTAVPGTVVVAQGNDLVLACGNGWLALEQVQPSGKRVLAAGEFLRGYPVRPGDRFGPDDELTSRTPNP